MFKGILFTASIILSTISVLSQNIKPSTPAAHNRNESKQGNGGTTQQISAAQLLFGNVKCNLSQSEKQKAVEVLMFSLSKDHKQFFRPDMDEKGEYPFDAIVQAVDLNQDGKDELIVTWGNSFTSGMGSTVTLLIKEGETYTSHLNFSGEVMGVMPSIHYGFPDLSFGAPGMRIPVWRYNGSSYDHFKSFEEAAYKQLKPITLEAFKKNPGLIKLNGKAETVTEPNLSARIFSERGAIPNARSMLLKRWVTVQKIREGTNNPEPISARDKREMQFDKSGKLYMYENGILLVVMSYVLAPDGRSMILSKSGEKEDVSVQILSLKANELVIRLARLFDGGTLIFKAAGGK